MTTCSRRPSSASSADDATTPTIQPTFEVPTTVTELSPERPDDAGPLSEQAEAIEETSSADVPATAAGSGADTIAELGLGLPDEPTPGYLDPPAGTAESSDLAEPAETPEVAETAEVAE